MIKLERKTRRLIVRVLAQEDYRAWREAYLSILEPRNRWDRGSRSPDQLTPKRFREVLASQAKLRGSDQFFDLGVFHKATGALLGMVSLMDLQRGLGQSAYLGYTIFNRHWGQGYGKESVRAAIDIGFRDLGLHRVEAGIEPGNRRSILLARSLGLRKEGLKKRAVFLKGRWVDLVMYSATTEDFGIRWKGNAETRPR